VISGTDWDALSSMYKDCRRSIEEAHVSYRSTLFSVKSFALLATYASNAKAYTGYAFSLGKIDINTDAPILPIEASSQIRNNPSLGKSQIAIEELREHQVTMWTELSSIFLTYMPTAWSQTEWHAQTLPSKSSKSTSYQRKNPADALSRPDEKWVPETWSKLADRLLQLVPLAAQMRRKNLEKGNRNINFFFFSLSLFFLLPLFLLCVYKIKNTFSPFFSSEIKKGGHLGLSAKQNSKHTKSKRKSKRTKSKRKSKHKKSKQTQSAFNSNKNQGLQNKVVTIKKLFPLFASLLSEKIKPKKEAYKASKSTPSETKSWSKTRKIALVNFEQFYL
jgi:hypothetical protein